MWYQSWPWVPAAKLLEGEDKVAALLNAFRTLTMRFVM